MEGRSCLAGMVMNGLILVKLGLAELISSNSFTGGLKSFRSVDGRSPLAGVVKNRSSLFSTYQLHTPDICLFFASNFMFFSMSLTICGSNED